MAEKQDLPEISGASPPDCIPSNEQIVEEVIKTCIDSNKSASSADKSTDGHLNDFGNASAKPEVTTLETAGNVFSDERSLEDAREKSSEKVETLTEDIAKKLVVNEGKDNNASGENGNCSKDYIPDDFEKDEKPITKLEDDFVDEELLKDAELGYTDEDKKRLRAEAESLKSSGNELFKLGQYVESAQNYTRGLRTCPLAYPKDRAILYANRAAAKVKLSLKPEAIEDCTKAVELDSNYLKAYYRRAQLYEETEKLDEALSDYQKILHLDPLHREALYASKRLPDMIQERNEKMKADMLAKLKDLGNMILRPFNLSTNNFQINQDPNTGGYSVNFVQNKQ